MIFIHPIQQDHPKEIPPQILIKVIRNQELIITGQVYKSKSDYAYDSDRHEPEPDNWEHTD